MKLQSMPRNRRLLTKKSTQAMLAKIRRASFSYSHSHSHSQSQTPTSRRTSMLIKKKKQRSFEEGTVFLDEKNEEKNFRELIKSLVKEEFLPWFVFTESGYLRLGYDWVVCLAGYLIILCVPLQCVYGMDLGMLHVVMLFLDALVLLDMLVTANLAFRPLPSRGSKLQPASATSTFGSQNSSAYKESSGNQLLEGRRRKIIWNYLSGAFFWDSLVLVPIFAMDLRSLLRFKDRFSMQHQLIALLKLAYVPSLTRAQGRLSRYNKIFHRVKMFYTDNEMISKLRIVYWFMLFLVFAHYMGMSFLFLGKVQRTEVTWISEQETNGVWQEYLESMYWALSSALTVGYGDVTPITYKEKAFTCIMFLVSTMIHASIMGAVTVLLGQMSNRNHAFLEKLQNAYHFFKRYRKEIPKEMRHRVIRYMDYNWQHQNILDINPIMGELPDHLEREIKIAIMQDIVMDCDLFRDVDPNFIGEVVMAMEQVNLLAGDCIFREGDLGTTMYFVHRGSLEVQVGGFMVASLETGNYFGEVSVLRAPQRRTATIKALSNCQLLTLSREPLKRILNMWPKMYRRLEKAANEKMAMNKKRNVSKVAKLFGSKLASKTDKSLTVNVTYDVMQELQKSDFALEIEQNISKRAQKKLKVLEIKLKAVSHLKSGAELQPKLSGRFKLGQRSKSEMVLQTHENFLDLSGDCKKEASQRQQTRNETEMNETYVNNIKGSRKPKPLLPLNDFENKISVKSIGTPGGHVLSPNGTPKEFRPMHFSEHLRQPESSPDKSESESYVQGLLHGDKKKSFTRAGSKKRLGSMKIILPKLHSKRRLSSDRERSGYHSPSNQKEEEDSTDILPIRSVKSEPISSKSTSNSLCQEENNNSPLEQFEAPLPENVTQGSESACDMSLQTNPLVDQSTKAASVAKEDSEFSSSQKQRHILDEIENMDKSNVSMLSDDSEADNDNPYSYEELRVLPYSELCKILSTVSQILSEQTTAT